MPRCIETGEAHGQPPLRAFDQAGERLEQGVEVGLGAGAGPGHDVDARRQLLAGLAEGLSAEAIRAAAKLSKTEYNSARRRIRRTLIREGLTCDPK